jgi:hypothetical protein
VTTGRSGTAFLTTLFLYVPGVEAFHEPEPEYYPILRDVQTDRRLAKRFLVEKKLPAIASHTGSVYVETSHLFCKGFLEPLLALDIVPDLIIHSRPHRQVATSLLKMGTVPGRTTKGLQFYLSPGDPVVLKLPKWETLHDYQLCYWYCLEMGKRARRYEMLYAELGGVTVRTTLDEVKTARGFMRLVNDLKLRKPNWFNRLRQIRNSRFKVNESKITKKPVQLPTDLDELEAEVRHLVSRADEEG